MAAPFQSDQIYLHRYEEPHKGSERLIFHDFLQALISIAIFVNGDLASSRDEVEVGVAKAFNSLIKDDMIPNLQLSSMEASVSNNPPPLDLVAQDKIDEIRLKFNELFFCKSKIHAKSALPGSLGDKTFTVREVISMLKDYNMIEIGGVLTVRKVIRVFSEIIKGIINDDTYNLEFELISEELFEGLVACSLITRDEGEKLGGSNGSVLEGPSAIATTRSASMGFINTIGAVDEGQQHKRAESPDKDRKTDEAKTATVALSNDAQQAKTSPSKKLAKDSTVPSNISKTAPKRESSNPTKSETVAKAAKDKSMQSTESLAEAPAVTPNPASPDPLTTAPSIPRKIAEVG